MYSLIINSLKLIDQKLSNFIQDFLKPYQIDVSHSLITQLLPQNIKLMIYFIIFILPFLILKILYPYNRIISLILLAFLITIGLLLFFIFIGFFNLLFAYWKSKICHLFLIHKILGWCLRYLRPRKKSFINNVTKKYEKDK